MRLILLCVTLFLTACGSVLEPVPCTPENATHVAYDEKDRLVAFMCL